MRIWTTWEKCLLEYKLRNTFIFLGNNCANCLKLWMSEKCSWTLFGKKIFYLFTIFSIADLLRHPSILHGYVVGISELVYQGYFPKDILLLIHLSVHHLPTHIVLCSIEAWDAGKWHLSVRVGFVELISTKLTPIIRNSSGNMSN